MTKYPLTATPTPAPNKWDEPDLYDKEPVSYRDFVLTLPTLTISKKMKRALAIMYFSGKPVPCYDFAKTLGYDIRDKDKGNPLNLIFGKFALALHDILGRDKKHDVVGMGIFAVFMEVQDADGEIVNCWYLRGRFRAALATCFDMDEWLMLAD